MGWFSSKKEEEKELISNSASFIQWIELTSVEQARELIFQKDKTVVFFKHSNTCSISRVALSRFEKGWHYSTEKIIPVYLDLWAHRDVSNFLSEHFSIRHESPQILVVKDEKCVHHASHGSINVAVLEEYI